MNCTTLDFRKRFLTDTDESGRFIVTSSRTGKVYFVEPIDAGNRRAWGSIDPATKTLTHKKGDGKYTGAIDADDSLITKENGFNADKVHMLEPGMSPHAYIEMLDAKYPTKQ